VTIAEAVGPPPKIIDFHTHFVDLAFPLTTLVGVPPPQRRFWEEINRRLADPDALISSIESSGIDARVISTPLEFVADADGEVPTGTIPRINDAIAELVHRHPERLYGLATVDAYAGEVAARELVRAVTELGLRGVFVESAKRDLLPDAAGARPTLAAAAELGVPVFIHPVEDPELFRRFKRMGRLGTRLTRGTINSAALFALLGGGVFEELPKLHVVVTALALGGLLLAGGFGDGARLRRDTPAPLRRNVYVDTTGLHPAVIRSAVQLLGADHVLLGTDWPVAVETRDRIQSALATSGLADREQESIAGRTSLKLLRHLEYTMEGS
jgi:aminocarboxymuconate-semialdehyde decarboxylase